MQASTGLGTTLIQSSHPIAFASKMLTDMSGLTMQTLRDRVSVSVLWSGEILYLHIWQARHGTRMTASHWKGSSISPSMHAPPALQQMLLHMQKYDYTIWYKPGKDMVLADHLSCFPSHSNYLPILIVHNVQHVHLSNTELDII